MKLRFLTLAALAVNAAMLMPANAAIYGAPTIFDHRIQTVNYNPDDVIKLKIKTGAVSLVQVSPNEEITSVALGDPLAWKVSVRNNSVFFRPVSIDSPDTNVAILTNKGRTYSLYLVSAASPTFVLRFKYPEKKTVFTPRFIPCTDGGRINGTYFVRGDKSIFPYQIWDDGRFTCLRFNNKQPMPVLYYIDADGKENLVNYNMEKNTMVIHQVGDKFVLRYGHQVAELKTENIVNRSWNSKGTTTRQKRVEKKADE